MQKMNAEDDTFRPGDLVRWIGEWPFPLVDSPPRENTVLAIRSDGNVELEGRHGNEAPQRWSCPPDQLVRHDAACAASQDEPVQDEDELPQCSACGETCHWNDEADRDDIDGVLCNPCAQRIASEFLADDARLRAAPGDLVEAADALRAELEASIHKSPPRGLALLLRYATGYLAGLRQDPPRAAEALVQPVKATDLRHALAAKLRAAAKTAAAWEEAAVREWQPLAPAYHDGDGSVTAAIEGPYIEHRLVMAWRGQVQRMADNLSADVPTRSKHLVERLDYSKPPPGYGEPVLIGEEWHCVGPKYAENSASHPDAIVAAWVHYKAHNDPPGMEVRGEGGTANAKRRRPCRWRIYTLGTAWSYRETRGLARLEAWGRHDRLLGLAQRLDAIGWAGPGDPLDPWPHCLTWSDDQVAEVERWLADSTAEMPEVLRG